MIRHPFARYAAALLLASSACSKCQQRPGTKGPDIPAHLSTEGELILWVPDLALIGDRISALESLKFANFISQLQGFPSGRDLVTELMRQIGLDLRQKEQLRQTGIDASNGMGVVLFDQNDGYSVVSIKDAAKFEEFVANVARTRLGLTSRAAVASRAGNVITFAPAQGAPPIVGYLLSERLAFVASSRSISRLAEWSALALDHSLGRNAGYRASLGRLGGHYDLSCFFPASSALSQRFRATGVTLLASLSLPQVLLRADLTVPPTVIPLETLEVQTGPDLTSYLPADAFAMARFQGSPGRLESVWPGLVGPSVERAVRDSGFDLKTEVLDNLKPGWVAAISVAPNIQLGGGIPQLDVRRTNPFGFLHLVALGEVKNSAKANATLEKIPGIAERFGARVTLEEVKGRRVYLSSYSQGEGVHFAVVADKAVIAGPRSRLEGALDAFDGKSKVAAGVPTDPAIKTALSEGSLSVVIDLHQLASSVRDLPINAWGLGGFAIKASAIRWLDAVEDLRAVTFNASSKDGAIQAVLGLRFPRQ